MNAIFRRYNIQAKKRNLIFELTKNEFLEITQRNCFYCNDKPSQIYKRDNGFGEFTYNGIDRKNNNIGYCLDNCVSCCWTCNVMKTNMEERNFYDHMIKILKTRGVI